MKSYNKQILAENLKVLMSTKPIDKITVVELVELSSVNRQTFYYHFQDIYDLLGYIYRSEAIDTIDAFRSLKTWKDGLNYIFKYVSDNRGFCINTYRSLAREHMEEFLSEIIFQLLKPVFEEINPDLNEDEELFILNFYTSALIGVLFSWLKSGLKEDYKIIVNRLSLLLDGQFNIAINKFI